jgi:hypothetical protein
MPETGFFGSRQFIIVSVIIFSAPEHGAVY